MRWHSEINSYFINNRVDYTIPFADVFFVAVVRLNEPLAKPHEIPRQKASENENFIFNK